jgi:hypothetical protein
MNKSVEESINYFFNMVGIYMIQEYDPQYAEAYGDMPTIYQIRDIVATYYWGGNNIPDTAGMMVDYFKKQGI